MTSIEFGTGAPPRRKASQNVVDRVAVRRGLVEFVTGIEGLQHEAAFLRAFIERPGTTREELTPRIVTLGQNVRDMSSRFEEAVASLLHRQQDQQSLTRRAAFPGDLGGSHPSPADLLGTFKTMMQ